VVVVAAVLVVGVDEQRAGPRGRAEDRLDDRVRPVLAVGQVLRVLLVAADGFELGADRAIAPSRLSNEWFSIITTTMWSNGIASVTVPAGRLGSGRLSGTRGVLALAAAARNSPPALEAPTSAAPTEPP
jgi:hypothetical protein